MTMAGWRRPFASSRRKLSLGSVALAVGWTAAPIYDRTLLGDGDRFSGPAIVTQLDATTMLLPGQHAEVHELGALIVRDDGN